MYKNHAQGSARERPPRAVLRRSPRDADGVALATVKRLVAAQLLVCDDKVDLLMEHVFGQL